MRTETYEIGGICRHHITGGEQQEVSIAVITSTAMAIQVTNEAQVTSISAASSFLKVRKFQLNLTFLS